MDKIKYTFNEVKYAELAEMIIDKLPFTEDEKKEIREFNVEKMKNHVYCKCKTCLKINKITI